MKNFLFLLRVLFLVFSTIGVVNATTIDYVTQLDGDGVLTTTLSGAIVEDFNTGVVTWNGTGDGSVYTGSNIGPTAKPYNNTLMSAPDSTPYLSVPNPEKNGVYTFTFDTNYNYFGLFWGSIDTYNKISFYNDGTEIEYYSGGMLPPPTTANGNQSSDTSNLYVNFYDINFGYGFDEIRLSSNGFAFEVDNLAVGSAPVPEPATMFLLGIGLLGLIGVNRRKK